MIYTCTVNPSLDYYLVLDGEVKLGEINRLKKEYFKAGGKGVNVSIVLNNLMMPSTCLGFLGGFVREHYLDYLVEYTYLEPRFTKIEGTTRINIKVNDLKETDINANGPNIKEEEFEKLYKRIDKIGEGDYFILSGTIQEELIDKMEEIVKELSEENVKIILDTNPELTLRCLKYHPLMVKANLVELEELANAIIISESDIIKETRKFVEQGAQNVLVSLGADGAMMINKDIIYRGKVNDGVPLSTTGCSDSMVAGYVFNLLRGANTLEAFKYACAAGSATAFVKGFATRDEINECYEKVEIKEIKE